MYCRQNCTVYGFNEYKKSHGLITSYSHNKVTALRIRHLKNPCRYPMKILKREHGEYLINVVISYNLYHSYMILRFSLEL